MGDGISIGYVIWDGISIGYVIWLWNWKLELCNNEDSPANQQHCNTPPVQAACRQTATIVLKYKEGSNTS